MPSPNIDSPWFNADGSLMRVGYYHQATFTIRYKSFGRVRFLPDGHIATYKDEWKRYVRWSTDPGAETLSADGQSQLKFDEGADNDPKGKVFPAPITTLLGKCAFSAIVFNLPHEYISSDPDFLSPDRVTARLGTLNSVNFLGSKPGTLLLMAAKFEEVPFPVAPDDPYDPITGWDVTFVWDYFDPPKGVPASDKFGHRLYPYRKDGKWYYCLRDDGASEMLPMTDHFGLLAHVFDGAVP